jgi:GDP-4-dehydro-6-deoxy-D-mannose reductase
MKILITGAAGFTAAHLVRELERENGVEFFFTDVRVPDDERWCRCDLSIPSEAKALLEAVKPDRVYHLAGTFSNVYETDYRVNVLSTKNILDATLSLDLEGRILLIGSSAEYGMVSMDRNPVREDCPLNPVSIYGLTKAFQTLLMQTYRNLYGLDVVMARTFNLFGRGLSEKLFVGRVYQQIEAFKGGRIPKIEVGNLESKRDYLSIEEAVKYYRLVMNCGVSGEVYNVGSGKSIMIRDLLVGMLEQGGLDMSCVREKKIVKTDVLDIPEIYADINKLNTLLD